MCLVETYSLSIFTKLKKKNQNILMELNKNNSFNYFYIIHILNHLDFLFIVHQYLISFINLNKLLPYSYF